MAVFKDNPKEWQRLDWQILLNGSISLYFKEKILNEAIEWFIQNNYNKIELDCSKWVTEEEFQKEIKSALDFPEYYGENLNSFNDCLSGLDIPNEGGKVIVFKRFDFFYEKFSDVSQVILDIIESNSRRFLLTGKRLITLLQSNDPRISFSRVGSRPIIWNSEEWLNKDRGL